MNEPPEPKPEPVKPVVRRRKRWLALKIVAGSFLFSLLCYLAWMLANRELVKRAGEHELAEARAKVESSDPDWTWEKLNAARPRPPEGKNGALLIPQIKKLTRDDWGKELGKTEWRPRLDVPPNVRYAPVIVDHVRRELGDSKEAVALARTLKSYPFGYRDIVLKPHVYDTQGTQDTRMVVDLLRWDLVLGVEDGDQQRAVDDLFAMLNASRSIGTEPFLISQLVRMALRTSTVQSTEWLLAQCTDVPELAGLQRALEADAEEPLLLYGVRGERAVFDRLFHTLMTEGMELGELERAVRGVPPDGQAKSTAYRDPFSRLGWWLYQANLPGERAYMLELMSQYVEVARRPVHEQAPLVSMIPEPPQDPRRKLSRLLFPAVSKVTHSNWRTTATARCGVIGIACERFRQQHKRWPESLAELVPAFLPAIPLDPSDGQPLRFAKSKIGIVFYSVGKRPPNEFGLKSPVPEGLPEGIELGFRLWNPDQRRLPPLPDPPQLEREPPP